MFLRDRSFVYRRPRFNMCQVTQGRRRLYTTRLNLWGLYAYNSADGYARHYETAAYRLCFTYGREVAAHLAASLWLNVYSSYLNDWKCVLFHLKCYILLQLAIELNELTEHWRTLEKQPLSSLRQFCASGPLSPSLSLAPASPFLFQSGRPI